MDRNGLTDKLVAKLNDDWEAYQLKEATPEAELFRQSLGKSVSLLKSVGQSNDPVTILMVEGVTLRHELVNYSNAPEMVNSIKPALEQLSDANETLKLVQDHDAYEKAARTYSSKRKQGGLPLDAFREFIKSHTARLTNRLKATSSVPEKNILRQRKDNLKVANQKYMAMQRQALGMELGQGLER